MGRIFWFDLPNMAEFATMRNLKIKQPIYEPFHIENDISELPNMAEFATMRNLKIKQPIYEPFHIENDISELLPII